MENQLEVLIKQIRNELFRFELIKKKLTVYNYSDAKLFEGPFGKSNQEDFIKKMNDAESILACLNNTVNEIEKIANREKKMSSSRIFRSISQHNNFTKRHNGVNV